MNSIVKKSHTVKLCIALISALLLVVAASIWVSYRNNAQAVEGTGHLITIYDRGEQQVLLSDGDTIADALR